MDDNWIIMRPYDMVLKINQYLSFLVENKSIKYENICFGDWSAANINEYLLYLENKRKHQMPRLN